jgi:hypothetical protein
MAICIYLRTTLAELMKLSDVGILKTENFQTILEII